jgi:hypothetical protein
LSLGKIGSPILRSEVPFFLSSLTDAVGAEKKVFLPTGAVHLSHFDYKMFKVLRKLRFLTPLAHTILLILINNDLYL